MAGYIGFDIRVMSNTSSDLGANLRPWRGLLAFAMAQFCQNCTQSGLNPWLIRARAPGILVYHCIVSLNVWSQFVMVYTAGLCHDWGECRVIGYWNAFNLFWCVWGAYYDPDDVGGYWNGILPGDIWQEWGDRMRIRDYRKDLDDHMAIVAMKRGEVGSTGYTLAAALHGYIQKFTFAG